MELQNLQRLAAATAPSVRGYDPKQAAVCYCCQVLAEVSAAATVE
jgi:hypothetical protein